MDEQHLHELFGVDIDNASSRSAEYKYLEDHIAGDQMYVDFAGDKLYLSDEKTGDKVPVEVFAAILPCGQITYYEAVPSQKKEYLYSSRQSQVCRNKARRD